jgi:glycosyltransferase involved in cell wall biosynthesis
VTPNGAPAAGRAVAYLINVYPAPSHSFIRREIAALESAGWRVHRFSHRRSTLTELDPADAAEQRMTQVLLESSWQRVLSSVAIAFGRRPIATCSAFLQAMRMARSGDQRFVTHAGYFVLACLLCRSLQAARCRHVHAHFGTNPAAVALLASRLSNVSYSLTFHGPHEFVVPERLNLRDKIAGASFVAVVSSSGQRAIEERYPAWAAKTKLVRCGLDAAWLDEVPAQVPRVPHLVCVARLDPQKNPLLLIAAAKQLQERGVRFHLTLIGDGSLRAQADQRLAELGLSAQVRLFGWATQQQVREHLRDSRALVLASDDEGLPVAIMEAFAAGRPAIAPDVGGVRELVETGVTGWLVAPRDAHVLADAMEQCLLAPTHSLQQLADNARRKVQSFDIRASAQTLGAGFDAALSVLDAARAADR